MKIGYARVSTVEQDTTAQHQALEAAGCDRIYIDHGYTGRNRHRPKLKEALAACRSGDTLVVTKLDRLARSVADASTIAATLRTNGVRLEIGGSCYDPEDPMGQLMFNVLAMIAEFEADLVSMRTRESLAAARAEGRVGGRRPKLTPRQQANVRRLYDAGGHTMTEIAELYNVSRRTISRALAATSADDGACT